MIIYKLFPSKKASIQTLFELINNLPLLTSPSPLLPELKDFLEGVRRLVSSSNTVWSLGEDELGSNFGHQVTSSFKEWIREIHWTSELAFSFLRSLVNLSFAGNVHIREVSYAKHATTQQLSKHMPHLAAFQVDFVSASWWTRPTTPFFAVLATSIGSLNKYPMSFLGS